MNYLEKFNPGRLLVLAFLFSANFVFAQKAHVESEVYVPVPMEEQPFFNNDELALQKAQQVSDFQMRIYAFAASTDQLSTLELIKTDLDKKTSSTETQRLFNLKENADNKSTDVGLADATNWAPI